MSNRTPVLVAADVAAFTWRDGRPQILLIRRGKPPFEGTRALPGGHLEPHQTLLKAARDELEQETSVRVSTDQLTLVGQYSDPDRDPRGRVVGIAFTAVLPEAAQARAGDDAASAEWVDLAKALAEPMAFDHRAVALAAADRVGIPLPGIAAV